MALNGRLLKVAEEPKRGFRMAHPLRSVKRAEEHIYSIPEFYPQIAFFAATPDIKAAVGLALLFTFPTLVLALLFPPPALVLDTMTVFSSALNTFKNPFPPHIVF